MAATTSLAERTQEPVLTDELIQEIREIYKHFPLKSAACIEGLKIMQKNRGWVSDNSIKELAGILEMSPDAVDSVATYYSLIFRRPVGRHVILVCDCVSCWLMGYGLILDRLEKRLGIVYGQTTPDDRFTLLPIPCLGACDHAPAMIINENLHQDLTAEKVDTILKAYE